MIVKPIVAVRLNPAKDQNTIWKILSPKQIEFCDNNQIFSFDNICTSSSNNEFFDSILPYIKERVAKDENCFFIIYAQKQSDQMLILEGDENQDGIIQQMIQFLYRRVLEQDEKIKMQCFGVCQEMTLDLLQPNFVSSKKKYQGDCSWLEVRNSFEFSQQYKHCKSNKQNYEKYNNQILDYVLVRIKYQIQDIKDPEIIFLEMPYRNEFKKQNHTFTRIFKQLLQNNRDPTDSTLIKDSLLTRLGSKCFIYLILDVNQDNSQKNDSYQFVEYCQQFVTINNNIKFDILKYLSSVDNMMSEDSDDFIQDINNIIQIQDKLDNSREIFDYDISQIEEKQKQDIGDVQANNIEKIQEKEENIKDSQDNNIRDIEEKLENIQDVQGNNIREIEVKLDNIGDVQGNNYQQNQQDAEKIQGIQNLQQISHEHRIQVLEDKQKLTDNELINVKRYVFAKKISKQNRNNQLQEKRQSHLKAIKKQIAEQIGEEIVGNEDFNYDKECFDKLSVLEISQFYQSFKKHSQKYHRLQFVIATDIQDIIEIKQKVICLFHFNLQQFSLLQYKLKTIYIIVRLYEQKQFCPSFVEKQIGFILINKRLLIKDASFMDQNCQIIYCSSKVNGSLFCKNLEITFIRLSQAVQLKIIQQLMEFKKLKYIKHLISHDKEVLSFIFCLEEEQSVILMDYFSKFARPCITVMDSDQDFEDIKEKLQQNNANLYNIVEKKFEMIKYK